MLLKSLKVRFAILLVALFAVPVTGLAEVYKYTDNFGRIYLTDKPMRGYKLLKVIRISTGARRTSPTAGLAELQRRRRAVEPLVAAVAKDTQVQADLLHAVIRAESAYDAKAMSSKGAAGLMQLMPATAKRYGVLDRQDPKQNVQGGASYLRDLLAMFDNDLRLALAAYNAGENAVIQYGRQIPPYPETQNYVDKVLTFLDENRRASKGERVAQN